MNPYQNNNQYQPNFYGRVGTPYTNTYTYVNGLEGAKAFQMLPNQMVLLMDSEKPYFYTKCSNNMGQSTIKIYKFEEVPQQEEVRLEYATKQDLQEIKDLIMSITTKPKESDNQ